MTRYAYGIGRRIFTASSVAILSTATTGCAPRPDAADAQRAAAPTTHGVDSLRAASMIAPLLDVLHHSLASCNAGAYSSDPPGTPAVRASTWATGAFRSIGRVSMFVPDSAQLTVTDTTRGAFGLAFKDCPGCRFRVDVAVDSTGKGVDGLVAALVAEQRTVDSAKKDPRGVMQFDVIDGPPTAIDVGGERAYIIDDDCGDCLAKRIVFGRSGYIATVSIGSDDDVPAGARHSCEMEALGKSLRWRE